MWIAAHATPTSCSGTAPCGPSTTAPARGTGVAAMSSRRYAFQYAVLRAVPRVDRGEFVNIGVVVYCQQLDLLRAAVAIDERRLMALDPEVDLEAVRTAASGIVRACQHGVG